MKKQGRFIFVLFFLLCFLLLSSFVRADASSFPARLVSSPSLPSLRFFEGDGFAAYTATPLIDSASGSPADEPTVLDMSSAEAFVRDVSGVYSITLVDSHGYLSGADGRRLMEDICKCLSRFSPKFINRIAELYAEYGSRIILRLDDPQSKDSGYVEWKTDLTISMRYNPDPKKNRVSCAVLAHELGHAVHFLINDAVGKQKVEGDLKALNGSYAYLGSQYKS